MTSLTIRLGTLDDVPVFFPWVKRAVAKMNAGGSDQWGADYPLPADFESDASRGELLVAVHNDTQELVGACCITLAEEPTYATVTWSKDGPAGVVHRMVVNPDVQRQGVAFQLFDACERRGCEQGAIAMHVDTYSMNTGMLAMFQKRGYTKRGEICMKGRPVPYYVYEKLL